MHALSHPISAIAVPQFKQPCLDLINKNAYILMQSGNECIYRPCISIYGIIQSLSHVPRSLYKVTNSNSKISRPFGNTQPHILPESNTSLYAKLGSGLVVWDFEGVFPEELEQEISPYPQVIERERMEHT